MATIAILENGLSNTYSVQSALKKMGAEVTLTADAEELLEADGVVLAGVGAFPSAMRRLRQTGLTEVLQERRHRGKPILGICLGFQMFFESSSEHDYTEGLGWLRGQVQPLKATGGFKVPHIGWNAVNWEPGCLLGQTHEDSYYYYLHSLAVSLQEEQDSTIGATFYGDNKFIAAVETHPIYGTQFHPENSSAAGLQLLNNFIGICELDKDNDLTLSIAKKTKAAYN